MASVLPVERFSRGDAWAKAPVPSGKAAYEWRKFAAIRLSQIDDEARALLGHAELSLDAVLDPLFDRFAGRVPEFGAWAFRWRTSYVLLREGVGAAAAWPGSDRHAGFRESIQGAWDDVVVGQFESLVLQPGGGGRAIEDAHRRWWDRVTRAIRDSAADGLLVVALYRQRPMDAGAELPEAAAAPPLPDDGFHPLNGTPGEIEGRMARPVMARLAFRGPAVVTAGVVGETLSGAADVAFLGGPASLALTVAGVLGIDYLISRLDEAVSRQAFEEDVQAKLRRAKADLRARWLDQARREIDRQLDYARAQLDRAVKVPVATGP
ncbi:MAG: hypothetical protein H7841_02445 [Magnetospirillum sp. WYHS-4]